MHVTTPRRMLSEAPLELGVSNWLEIDQERIDSFGRTTGDLQWIHVDPERAASGPFGTTVAHGYLVLSLVPLMFEDLFLIEEQAMGMNYGLDRLRFTAPIPVGSRIRLKAGIASAVRQRDFVRYVISTEVEREGGPSVLFADITFISYPTVPFD